MKTSEPDLAWNTVFSGLLGKNFLGNCLREALRTQHAEKNVFFIPLTTCIPQIA